MNDVHFLFGFENCLLTRVPSTRVDTFLDHATSWNGKIFGSNFANFLVFYLLRKINCLAFNLLADKYTRMYCPQFDALETQRLQRQSKSFRNR